MKIFRTSITALLILGLTTPAFAGDLASSVAKAVEEQQQRERAGRPLSGTTGKPLVWTGAALFVGGMAVGLFAFINNQNGEFSEFGEANAVNKKLGAAGLSTAFVGGTLMFLGSHRASRAPSIAIAPGRFSATKQLSW